MMLHPLATLWRHAVRVTFYESDSVTGHVLFHDDRLRKSHAAGARRHFSSADVALNYLRYWLGEPAARAELRWVLQRSGPSQARIQGGIDGWLHALAGRLVGGALVVLEETSRYAMPGRLIAPSNIGTDADIGALPKLS